MKTKEIAKVFNGHGVRVIIKNGVEWFVARDVCEILELTNVTEALRNLEIDERAALSITEISSNGVKQKREANVINESGLYTLIFKSRKPEAKAFRKWVTSEVLPSIRKTGKYDTHDIQDKSKHNRSMVTSQWQRQGVKNPVEYAMLTKEEYYQLYGNPQKKKTDMNRQEILKLSAFEAVESWKLSEIEDEVLGYIGCKSSINETAVFLSEVKKSALLQVSA